MSTHLTDDLRIERLLIRQLRLDPRNPRRHGKHQIKQIARSIETFGFIVPVLVDKHHNVIAGHGRVLAGQLLGLDDVPVIRLEHLSEAKVRAFRVADNRLSESSTWNDHLLAGILEELSALDLEFSIEATGFSMGEIDLRIESLSTKPEEEADPADELREPPNHPAVSMAGDLWILERHRLLCGNALDAASYQRLMDGQQHRSCSLTLLLTCRSRVMFPAMAPSVTANSPWPPAR